MNISIAGEGNTAVKCVRMLDYQEQTGKTKRICQLKIDLKFCCESYFHFLVLTQSDADFTLGQFSLHFFLKFLEFNSICFLSNNRQVRCVKFNAGVGGV